MRTKQEVISFLESKVGKTVPCVGNSSLDGQCVTLIKALMEFLGVPNPYKARGHAKTVISAYLNEGIADPGIGFLSVFSNKNMGGGYGHIWCNAGDGYGTYYEQNGQKSLTVTKGKTYSYDNVCNFDKYITENSQGDNNMSVLHNYLGVTDDAGAKNRLKEHLGEYNGKCDWGNENDDRGGFLGSARRDVKQLREKSAKLESERNTAIQSEKKTAIKLSETEELLNKKTKELAQCQLEAEQHTCEFTENDISDAHDDGYNEARAEYRPYDYREMSAFDLIGNGILKLLGKKVK